MSRNTEYVQFSIRLTRRQYEALQRRVENVNQEFEASGSPGVVTLSRLASFYVVERLADELQGDLDVDRPPTKQMKSAKDLNKAIAALRGRRV
jgi:hypothetical protein